MHARVCAQSCSRLREPWTAARQAPLSMGLSRQEYWSGLPFPPDPGVGPASPPWQAAPLLLRHRGSHLVSVRAEFRWGWCWFPARRWDSDSGGAGSQPGAGAVIQAGNTELQPLNIRRFQTREEHSDRRNSTHTEGTASRRREQHPEGGTSMQTEGTASRLREQHSDGALRWREQHSERGNSRDKGEDLSRSPPPIF